MRRNERYFDLRMLSLLCALHDSEGFAEELGRLIESGDLGSDSWKEIDQMVSDLGLDETSPITRTILHRRREVHDLHMMIERRKRNRRAMTLAYVGKDRRKSERRHH